MLLSRRRSDAFGRDRPTEQHFGPVCNAPRQVPDAHRLRAAEMEQPVREFFRRHLERVPERYARPGDVVLTLGAGDLTTLPDLWLEWASEPT